MLVTLSGIVMFVSPVQSRKAYDGMIFTLSPIFTVARLEQPSNIGLYCEPALVHAVAFQLTVVSPVQPRKAPKSMLVTLSGIVMLVSPVQPKKAPPPMLVTLSGIVMLVSPVQSEKAEPPMLVTLSGIVMLVSPVQSRKAPPPMPNVPSFNTIEVLLDIVPLYL